MSNWKRTLNLLPEWNHAKDNEIDFQELAGIISLRLDRLAPFSDRPYVEEARQELVYEFESLSLDDDATVEDFDSLMNELYDWADTSLDGNFGGDKVCWVKTF